MAGLFLSTVTTINDFITGRGRSRAQGSYGNVYTNYSAPNNAGVSVDVDTLLSDGTVIAGVNAITTGISQIPMMVHRKTPTGYVAVPMHPVQMLLDKPNEWQTPSEFKEAVVTSILVYGSAFIRIIRVGGKPMQLVPLNPYDMTIGRTGGGLPSYEHNTYGKLSNDEVAHIRDVSTYAVEGTSRLLLAGERVAALKAADKLMSKTFRNGISVNYVVQHPSSVNADDREAFGKMLAQAFGQQGNSTGSAVLLEGGASMQALKGATPADSDLRELRRDLIREIAAVLGVPPFMMGVSGDEKYNNVRQKTTSFHRDTLNPIMNRIEEALTMRLLEGNECIKFDIEDFIKGAYNEQVQLASQAVQAGIFSPNEARTYLGKSPISEEMPEDGNPYDYPVPPNSTSTTTESVSETVESTGGEDGPQSLENRPEREGGEDE